MKAINKLLKRKKKPKILSTGPTLNQSMIDIIVNDRPANESFHSQQGGLMRSPSIGGNEVDIDDLASTDRIDTMFDSPNRIPMKANIGSVLNMPKRRNIIEDLYEILHEQVIEQIGDLISAKKNSIKETDIPKVQLSDFQEYIQRLKSVHQIYKKQNYRRMDKRRKNEKVDIPASLAHCYRVVPELYFAANFEFNFEYLTSDKAKVMKVQEDIGGFLDLVEFNLHLQLTNRFQEFVDVILKLSQMEAQIQNSLFVTSFFRDLNKDLRLKCSQQVAKVLSNKRKKFNMQKTLELAKVINSVRQIIPTLVQLVEKNNLEEAMTLIKTSEETYRTQLIRLKAVKHLIMDFKDARNILEKLVTGKFEEKYLAYVTPALRYTKKAQTPYMSDMSIVEESFINVSTMEGSQTFDDEPSSHLSLNWTLDPFKPNEQIETYLVSTVLEYIKIKAFSLNQCREKLNTLLTRFHKQFVADMDEYIASIGINKAIPGHESATFDLHIKFIMFYFQIWKRFIQTNLSLVSNIFTKIMNYSNKNFAKSNDQGINQESLQNIGGTIEETYSTLAIIFKQFNEKISEVISKQSVDNISSHQFSKLTSLFNEITNFFDREIRLHDRLTGWIVSDSEKIKQPLLNLAESFAGRINITPVINLKTQCGKEFIAYFHKHNFDSLKHNLENDAWVVSDIPYTYKTYFDILFGVKQTVGKSPAKEKNELDEDIFKSARPDVNDLEIIKKLALGDTFTQRDNNQTMEITQQDIEFDEKEVVEIKKNELVVHDKRFKVNSSLLVLIKMSCDYFNIACRFNQISELTISRLFDLIKFYNSFSRRLVYGAEATMLGKVKKITAKILVLSLVSLDLLDILITSFHQTIENSVKDIRQDWLNAEITTIRQEIRTHINDIKNKIRMILKSKLNELSLDLKNIGWGDPQGKVNIPTKSSAGILHNTRQMYKNIEDILIKEHLIDVFNSIFKDLKDYFIPVFESLPIENKIAAKRVKEELDYFTEDLYHIPVFQEPELNFGEFRNKIKEILEKKCNHLLEPEQKQNGEAEPEAEAEEKPVEEPQLKEEEQQERLEENGENGENGEKEDQPEEKPEENEEKEEKEENEEKIEIEIEKTEKEENIEAEDNAAVEDGAENGAGDV